MAKQKGIDISYWQEKVDFAKIKNDGIQFVILREGYRKTLDERFIEYANGFKNVGIPILGVYHFLYTLTTDDAIAEAKSCIANVQKAGLGKDVIIFADFEYDTVTKARAQGVTLGKTQCIAHTKAFCEYVESQGYRAGIYTNIDYYRNMYEKSLIDKYVFWLADYTGDPDYTCVFHQYSSSGKVNGINGNVDMNYYYGEIKTTTTTTKKATTTTTKKSVVNVNFSQYYGKISNSGGDEYGGIHGGAAGDQTGNEWCIRSWYNRPWSCVLRHPNQEVRELIAELGIEAANNNKIGYDQYQRDTYWNQLQSVGYRPSKITVACESDCSAGVIANTKAVGYLLGISALKNIGATYTGNMRSAYQNAGFQVLTESKYLTSSDYLVPGDILLNDTHHTATNLGIGSKSGYSGNGNNTIVIEDSTNTPSNPSKPNTTVKWQGKVTADELNVRTWAGTENGTCSFSPLKEGTIIGVCDTVYASNGNAWYYIKYNGKYGFVHSAYVAKVETITTTTKKATTTTKKATTTTKKATTTTKKATTTTSKSSGINKTPQWQGVVTASALNVRTWAGVENAKCSFSPLPYGTIVDVCDTIKDKDGDDWYYIKYNGKYGFVSSSYVKKK